MNFPIGKRCVPKDGSPQGGEGTSWQGEGEVSREGWSHPGSGRSFLVGEGWFPGKGGLPRELTEPLNGDKVVSPKRVVSPGETLQPRMMMSSRIGCSTVGRGEWGSLDNIGLPFP